MSKLTLFELDVQQNGEKRWSLVNHGPVAYLTCDSDMANRIVTACNALPALVVALERISTCKAQTTNQRELFWLINDIRIMARAALAQAQRK